MRPLSSTRTWSPLLTVESRRLTPAALFPSLLPPNALKRRGSHIPGLPALAPAPALRSAACVRPLGATGCFGRLERGRGPPRRRRPPRRDVGGAPRPPPAAVVAAASRRRYRRARRALAHGR